MWLLLLTLFVIIVWGLVCQYKDMNELKKKSKRYEE